VYAAPIPEVSGACFAGRRLVLVGDRDPVLAWAAWEDGPGDWTVLDVAGLPGAPAEAGQFEAVAHVGGDVVVILCEEPALLVGVDLAVPAITGTWRLRVGLEGLARPWRKDPNSRGEGLFFGDDRVYVTKEKKPAALIEFGPAGAAASGEPKPGTWNPPPAGDLVALGAWDLDLPDVSDACVDDGVIWLLSDKAGCRQPLGGEPIALPSGFDKAEGLARTPQGDWLVALDNADGRDAIRILEG
jgi:hypothetical protein